MVDVDIIIPVFNDEEYIISAVESALSQKDITVRVIVIDDGSTDGTAKKLRLFNDDSRVLVIGKENGGVASARNVGLRLVDSNYCCFLDSDDILSNDFCTQMIEYMSERGYKIACSEFYYLTVQNGEQNLISPLQSNDEYISFADLLCENKILTPTCLFKTELMERTYQDEGLRFNEDWLFWLELVRKAGQVGVLHKRLVNIRTRPTGLSANTDLKRDNYLFFVNKALERFQDQPIQNITVAAYHYSKNLIAFGMLQESGQLIKQYGRRMPIQLRLNLMGRYIASISGVYSLLKIFRKKRFERTDLLKK